MNFFSKNKFIYWLLIFLVVLNLSAFITFLVLLSQRTNTEVNQLTEKPRMAFRKELALSPAQFERIDAILTGYKESIEPVTTDMRNNRAQLLEELAKNKPDTNVLNQCVDKISTSQKQIQKASIAQYIALKEICTPNQCQRLSALYFEFYGCQENFKGKGQGKGMMHQYRRGQGHSGRGNGYFFDEVIKHYQN